MDYRSTHAPGHSGNEGTYFKVDFGYAFSQYLVEFAFNMTPNVSLLLV